MCLSKVDNVADPAVPKVSIGVPVYNGAGTVKAMLESLLSQSFTDLEIIISDNASTDDTGTICASYAARDSRIRYIRQPTNIGAEMNFKFVMDEARGTYFMWSACDDIRSPEFVEENVHFLNAHPGYVSSTCPNCFEGRSSAPVTFAIEGNVKERIDAFLKNALISQGIFYGLIRTEVLRECETIGQTFFAADWAVILYLASRGNIHRTEKGMMVSGAAGISNQVSVWRKYRSHWIGWLFPFYRVSLYAMKLSSSFECAQRLSLMNRLFKLNAWGAYSQFHSEFIKPWIRAAEQRRLKN
jgi:glycosyltransferase involved in cell wall biosynthesis